MDPLTDGTDDLLVSNVTLDENGRFTDGDDVEIQEARDAAPPAPAVPPDDDDDIEIEFDDDVLVDSDEGAPAQGDDEYEDVEADEAFAANWQQQAQQQRINQAEAQAAWAQAQAQAQVAQSNLAQVQLGLETVEQRRALYNQAMQEAHADGDQVRAMQIQRSLDELDGIERELANARQQIPHPDAILNYGRQQAQAIMSRQPSGKTVGAGLSTNNPVAERWAQANSWMQQQGPHSQFILNQSEQMVRSGWNPNEPGFYAELGRRLKSAFPQLPVKAPSAKKGAKRVSKAPRGPVTPGRSRTGAPPRQQRAAPSNARRYTLSKSDIAAMRRMALDPGNREHRTYFAKSRIESRTGD